MGGGYSFSDMNILFINVVTEHRGWGCLEQEETLNRTSPVGGGQMGKGGDRQTRQTSQTRVVLIPAAPDESSSQTQKKNSDRICLSPNRLKLYDRETWSADERVTPPIRTCQSLASTGQKLICRVA